MSDNPTFTAVGDEPLEARIVAWVLGDASAFEATELERLCTERPELVVFRRRMRALHGLLTEAEAAQPDLAWKLPPEKRKVLDEIFGAPPKLMPAAGKTKSRASRRRARWVLYGLAACAVFMLIMLGFSAGSLGMKKARSISILGGTDEKFAYASQNGRTPLQTEYPPELIEGTPKPIHLPGSADFNPAMDRSYAAARSSRDSLAKQSGPAPATEPAASRPSVTAANSASGRVIPSAESPASKSAAAFGDSLSNPRAFRGGAAESQKAAGGIAKSKLSGQPASGNRQMVEEKAAEITARMADDSIKVGEPAEAQPLASATTAPGGGGATRSDLARNQLSDHGSMAGEKPAPAALSTRRGITLGVNGGRTLLSGDGAINENSIDAGLERAEPTVATGTVTAAADGLADGSKIDRQTRFFRELKVNSAIATLDDDATATRTPAKPGEPPPPAAPGQPASAGVPALGDIPTLGRLMTGKTAARGEREDQTEAVDKSHPLAEGKPTDSAAQAPQGPAAANGVVFSDSEFDMVENLKRQAPAGGRTAGNADELDLYTAGADRNSPAPTELRARAGMNLSMDGDESAGEEPEYSAGYAFRFRERRLEDLPAPSIQPRPGSSVAWHAQDEATKARQDTNRPADDFITGGLKSDLASDGSLAEREMVRRQSGVAEADRLLQEGRDAFQRGDFEQAETRFKSAEEKLPDAPALADRKQAIADAREQVRQGGQGNLDDARALLNKALAADPNNEAAAKSLAGLGSESARNTDAVRKKLYTAEGAYNLGKYDQAKTEYENVLRSDPYNTDARRGLETIASAKSAYYRAAYDQTRSELLTEVDKAWEMSLPADAASLEKAVADQKQKVEESKKALAQIVKQKGIIWYGQDSTSRNGGMEKEAGATAAHDTYTALETEKLQLDSMMKTLLKYDDEQFMAYAVGIDLPDNAVRPLYPAYLEAKTQLENNTRAGHGPQHPLTLAKQKEVEALKKQLDEGAAALRATLQAKRELAEFRLERAKVALHEKKGRAVTDSTDRTDFDQAKSTFEAEAAKLAALKVAALKAKLAAVQARSEPVPVDPGKEIAAAEDPYSTFSLSISDASFKTAQAALAKGEVPDPAGIRIEQFYNAMDYGDPAPASGEPVAAKIEQAAHPVVPGRNLVRVALRTAATGRSAAQPLQLTLLIDQSGSMARDDRKRAMDRALKELATLLTPNDRVTVVGFSLAPRLLADSLPGDQAGKLSSMINLDANEGGTNLERAMLLGSQLATSRKKTGAQNRLVLFTDGAANLGNANPERLAQTVKEMRQNGLAFDVAGLGTSELNDRLLAELARHGNGRFYVVDAATDEPNSFAKQLAGAFRPAAENVKVQVRFNPQRVKGYKLIGFEEHRLKQEDFRNDAVDAAELAAEEAGVALYQVQPLPSGSGDLGEVSVRFRDTATGQMVERSWSIPYDPSAPGFDQATPSLQLAGLAMLGAEKLRGGPMAAAIDFGQFTSPRATIRQTYPHARRVAELLEMIDRLR